MFNLDDYLHAPTGIFSSVYSWVHKYGITNVKDVFGNTGIVDHFFRTMVKRRYLIGIQSMWDITRTNLAWMNVTMTHKTILAQRQPQLNSAHHQK